jgi:hypothetical protein
MKHLKIQKKKKKKKTKKKTQKYIKVIFCQTYIAWTVRYRVYI